MKLDEFTAYCLAKPGVTQDLPMKGEVAWMKVAGKMFAMTNVQAIKMDGQVVQPFHFVNLKCDPERAVELREQYTAIGSGWHQNKTHWNTVFVDPSIPDALIRELTDHSYDLVAASLPKKARESLGP